MKTKVLMSACALAACFAACTNDEFLSQEQDAQAPAQQNEIVGHDLVSRGMHAVVSKGGADTRVDEENGWEQGDQLGLAWYKVTDDIDDEQTENAWESLVENHTGFANDGSCDNIYANHIFTNCSDGGAEFKTTTNVYQGAYFMYFPYQRLNEVKPLELEPNQWPQKEDFRKDVINNATYISAQDFIGKEEGVNEDNVLTKTFYITSIVNAMGISATPGKAIAENDFMKGLKISGLTLNLGANINLFLKKAQVVTRYIPAVVRNVDGTVNEEETLKALYRATDLLAKGTNSTENSDAYLYVNPNTNEDGYTNTLTTKVENEAFTLAETRQVRMFTFPTKKVEGLTWDVEGHAYGSVSVISENGNSLGSFIINISNSPKLIGKLERSLKGEGNDSLQVVHRTSDNNIQGIAADMDANLLAADFVPDTYVASESKWDDLMKLFDALYACGVRYYDGEGDKAEGMKDMPVVRVGANVDLSKCTVKAPENVKIQVVSENTNGHLIIGGNMEWPGNLIAKAADEKRLDLVVNKGVELTYNPAEADELDADITNNGTIKAGPKASICTSSDAKLDNKNGRVIVEYGAYVYPSTGNEGVIAYEVKDNEPLTIGRINTLITESTPEGTLKGYAQVNTLMVEGTTLDLNAKASSGSEGDRYEQDSKATTLKDLSDVTIELYDGVVEKKLSGTNTSVAGVAAVDGTNTMTDIKTPTITVDKGATLNVESATKPDKTPLTGVESVTNRGTLNFNVDGEIESVHNYGYIDVISPWTVTYNSLTQTNPEGDQGRANGNFVPAYRPNQQELAAAANGVKSAWNTLSANDSYKNVEGLEALVTTINSFAGKKAPQTAAFVEAINDWLEKYYGNKNHNVEIGSITEEDLEFFQTMNDYEFFTE